MQHPWLRRLSGSLIALSLVLPLSAYAQDGKQNGKKTDGVKPVTHERLLKGTEDSSASLMYGGNYQGWRFSPLKDVNRQHVQKLLPAWMFQTGNPSQLEASPIVADGIIYRTAAYNHLFARAAATGEPLWKYDHPLLDDMRVCCGPTNRGVALADDKVFMGTLDARLVALDRKTGAVVWNSKVDDYANGYSVMVAPLVVKDKVVLGIAGGDYGARGYIDAYDVKTGERKWRRYTVPATGEKGNETWPGDAWKR